MRLTDYTDYTLRALIYLGLHRDELVTIQQIADSYAISKNHLMKIINRLSQDGLVESVRGRSGGVRLAKHPFDVNLGALVRATEQDFRLVECFSKTNNHCVLSSACRLQQALHQAMDAFFAVLDGMTLEDVLGNAEELRPLVELRVLTVKAKGEST